MTSILLLILAVFLVAAGVLLAWSPGRPAALRDAAGNVIKGSISERTVIEINGVQQGMIIQSADSSLPVLLFVHGGPGMPEYFLNGTHPAGLERHFTMVWWEQRGAGISYSAAIREETMTVDQLVADTIAVADYLRNRFGEEKIYLLGHSWGSFIGIQAAAAAPDRFHAYIGMSQVSHQLQSEVLAFRHMLEAYRKLGDAGMLRRLEAAPVTMAGGLPETYMRLRDEAMHRLGIGTTREMRSVITGVFLPVWRCEVYTVREKINIWRGKAWSRRILWNEFLKTDLAGRLKSFDLPVYFLVGRHDYTANADLARAYFRSISAPMKGLYVFGNSAHSPLFEEPAHARDILLKDVVGRSNRLADET